MRLAPCKAGVAHFANGIKAIEIGLALLVDNHTATGVVGGRDDRDRLFGDINAEGQQFFVNGREVLGDKISRFVADIEVHAIGTQALHLEVDGAGDHIARGQLATLIEVTS